VDTVSVITNSNTTANHKGGAMSDEYWTCTICGERYRSIYRHLCKNISAAGSSGPTPSDQSAREFWLGFTETDNGRLSEIVYTDWGTYLDQFDNVIHVIERRYATQLERERDELRETLRCDVDKIEAQYTAQLAEKNAEIERLKSCITKTSVPPSAAVAGLGRPLNDQQGGDTFHERLESIRQANDNPYLKNRPDINSDAQFLLYHIKMLTARIAELEAKAVSANERERRYMDIDHERMRESQENIWLRKALERIAADFGTDACDGNTMIAREALQPNAKG
jgi:hypothetical protein